MKKMYLAVLLFLVLISACSPDPNIVKIAIEETITAYTPQPTQTYYPTSTPNPTYTPAATYTPYPTATKQPTIVRVIVQTPTVNPNDIACTAITKMEYGDNSKAFVLLQAYVASLPGVRSVSYTIPERLYSNTLSHIVFVRYIADDDGELYSKRYIIYVDEFGWSKGVYSIDGQCWIDGPH